MTKRDTEQKLNENQNTSIAVFFAEQSGTN